MRTFLTLLFIIFLTPAHAAGNEIQVIESKYSVKESLDRLSATLTEKGIRVVARVNHAAGAKAAGLKLQPTELLIFGNPKLGTPLMQADRMIGLDLPMKVLAWQDDAGQVRLAYVKPDALKDRHGLSGKEEIFEKMAAALADLTAAAAGTK